jgi:hypothetical protein
MEMVALGMIALPMVPLIVVYILGFVFAFTALKGHVRASRNAAIGFVLLLLGTLTQLGMQGMIMHARNSGLSVPVLAGRAAAFGMLERLLTIVGMVFLLLAILADRRDPRSAG